MAFIYKVTNLINGKVYIGQTTNTIEERFKQHKKHNKYLLGLAFKKYGTENFKVEQLEECVAEMLNKREVHWISYYNSYGKGYNSNPGGDCVIMKAVDCYLYPTGELFKSYASCTEAARDLNLPESNAVARNANRTHLLCNRKYVFVYKGESFPEEEFKYIIEVDNKRYYFIGKKHIQQYLKYKGKDLVLQPNVKIIKSPKPFIKENVEKPNVWKLLNTITGEVHYTKNTEAAAEICNKRRTTFYRLIKEENYINGFMIERI